METYRKSRNLMFLFKMRAITVMSLMVAMGSVAAIAAPINVYWTARGTATLNKTDVGSGTTTQLTSTNGRLQDVDLDAGTNTLYFADWGVPGGDPCDPCNPGSAYEGAIHRIQTDGTGLGLVLGGGVLGDAVHQLALDTANDRIYFTQAVSYANRQISRVDTSGANYTQLLTGTGFSYINGWFYSGLAVDVANNTIYWGDIGTEVPAPPADGAVNSMTLTGAAPTSLVPHVDGKGRGFALDQASQTLFYTAHDPLSPTTGGALYSYDIVNNIETQLISDPCTGYWDIEIDSSTNRIWWADSGRGQIWSANFDGSNPVVELTGLTDVYGLALEFPEVAAPFEIYWTARSAATLNKTDVASGTTTQLTSTNGRLQDVDLDAETNTLYFADWGVPGGDPCDPCNPGNAYEGAIHRIQTDGTGLGLVLGGGVLGDAMHQLALDTTNNHIYFTRAVSYANREISRVDTSGANYTLLRNGSNGWYYSGLAVDIPNNTIYWAESGLGSAPPADGSVNSMTLTGTAPTALVPHVDGKGRGFALDQASQTLFYTAHDVTSPNTGGAVYSYDIVNNIETQLISDPCTGYWDIEINPSTNRIWWTDNGRGQIWSANFDGSNPVVELTGLTDVYGLALGISLSICGDPSHPYPIGDLNQDCVVDLRDFAIFVAHIYEDNRP